MSSEASTSFRLSSDPAMPRPGDCLDGRYVIESVLGEGGFAAVFRAKDNRTDGVVAIKILDPLMSRRDEFAQRFHAEIRTASRLKHLNTIRVFDSGKTPTGCLYLVMELLNGQALDDLLKKNGPMPAHMVQKVAIQVLRALQEAHDNNIIHRDIKPGNIFLLSSNDPDDVSIKVLDFGIAKTMDSDAGAGITSTGQVMCSPHYVAPERIIDHVTLPTSDIYSVGVTMIELLEGKAPIDAETPMQIVMMHANKHIPVPMDASTILGPLGPILEKATSKDYFSRYQNAREMITDLLALSGGSITGHFANAGIPPTAPHGALYGTGPTGIGANGASQATPAAGSYISAPTTDSPEDGAIGRKTGVVLIIAALLLLAIGAVALYVLIAKDTPVEAPQADANTPAVPHTTTSAQTESEAGETPPPLVEKGIVISSVPSNARITINGAFIDITPATVARNTIPQVPFDLAFTLDDGRREERRITHIDELTGLVVQFPPAPNPTGESGTSDSGTNASPTNSDRPRDSGSRSDGTTRPSDRSTTNGSTTNGSTTNGSTTNGSTTNGSTTNGGANGNTATGDTSSGNAGNSTSGGSTSGSRPSGNSTSGGTSGSSTSGSTTSGNSNSGNSSSGNSSSGGLRPSGTVEVPTLPSGGYGGNRPGRGGNTGTYFGN